MNTAYEPKKYESNILKAWDTANISQPETKENLVKKSEKKTSDKTFCVPIPPPNVTGQLHLGHAMMLVIQDIMTRYNRMNGTPSLWTPGTDHAAIATETVVLKNLGVSSREEFTRPEFLEKCFEHTEKTHATITGQVSKMGATCDFSRERFTMDLGMSNAVQKIFSDLYSHNLIVRGYRMINWSTGAQSVLSDDELEYEDQTDTFCYIKSGKFVMGTVRAETKCANSPLVLHPTENYVKAKFTNSENISEEFIFSEVLFDDIERRTKIFNELGEGTWEKISVHQGQEFEGEKFSDETYSGKRDFFVLCDDEVIDINKGTGAMTISVCHSADDYLLAKKYPEKLKNYYTEKIDFEGKMTKIAGELEGVEVKIARKRAVKLMLAKNLIVGLEKDYVHNVPLCYRTGCVIEPMISPQWFIDVNKKFDWIDGVGAVKNATTKSIKTTLKELTSQAINRGDYDKNSDLVNLVPNRFNKIYDQWIDNLQDWCISRQIWWGHQIPIWYDKDNNQHVAKEQKLLFTRHGESENNVNQIICGDSPLTEKGKQQAKELGLKLKKQTENNEINITKVISSSFDRAFQTAKIACEEFGYNSENIEVWDILKEFHAGKYEGQPKSILKTKTALETIQAEEGLEAIEKYVIIAKKFWEKIAEVETGGEILIVGHAALTSFIFAVKNGATKETIVEHWKRWKMDNCEIKESLLMVKPVVYEKNSEKTDYSEYFKNIENLLNLEKQEKLYDKNKFFEVGKLSPEMQEALEISTPTVQISEFIYAKMKGWIPKFLGHNEIENSDFYLLPYFLEHATEIYENSEKNERYLIAHAPHDEQSVVIVLDSKKEQNEIVSYFFLTNSERYLESLVSKQRYHKKRSLEGPTAPSCITSQLRKDAKRLVVGFPSRQTPLYKDFNKFFENIQEKTNRKIKLRQDEDTLDTWFSSALWPFSTLGWPDKTPDFEKFFPTSVLETGHDILFFWVARMIMFSKFTTGKNPFSDVYLHGLVCDEHGKKMSKSKGNGIDPLDMIEKFGTDAVRMSLIIGTTPGNQVNLGEKKIEGFRNFANKLWNVSRYIKSLENNENNNKTENISLPEKWILSKTQKLIEEVRTGIENHKYGEVGQKLYDFTWNELADWAIESAKSTESKTIGRTLQEVLTTLLKLLHPYIPFVTEQIWSEFGNTTLLALEDFPEINTEKIDISAEEKFEIFKNVTAKIRSLRSASKVDPVKKIKAVLFVKNSEILQELQNTANTISSLARLETLTFITSEDEKPSEECVSDIIDGTEIFLPLAGMLDMEKEKERKEKELESAYKMLQNLEKRIANKKYMDNAPDHLVAQTKAQYEEIKEKISVLEN